jgi:hypothetical protein
MSHECYRRHAKNRAGPRRQTCMQNRETRVPQRRPRHRFLLPKSEVSKPHASRTPACNFTPFAQARGMKQ